MTTISDIINSSSESLSSPAFYKDLDKEFKTFRNEFVIPTRRSVSGENPVVDNEEQLDEECTYLCGNSLGLLPKRSRELIIEELDAWGKKGVEGHWNHPYGRNWVTIDETVKAPMARAVGAKPVEVTTMSSLTSNIHSMLISFYRPTESRFKILIEQKAFPSDHYAAVSHLESRGINADTGLLTIAPRKGEQTLRTEDIIDVINKDKEIAVVMLSGIQYYTGQLFDMEKITKAGQEAGCIVGWDLAHAVGNVPLKLHDWNVDFACWCSYKYLNSGAGGISGIFVHEKHHNDQDRPRLAGWWGNRKENRFDMIPEFQPSEGASGYQTSNPSIFTTVSLLGSLEIFESAGGVEVLREKSVLLTGYLEKLLLTKLNHQFESGLISIITPKEINARGCQLSLEFPNKMMDVFNALGSRGIVVDDRKPTVIRVAPTPLYNTFKDCYIFVQSLEQVMNDIYIQ